MSKLTIFCFTYAGGTSDFFKVIEGALEPEIELVKLEYPGHGKRGKERLCETFEEVSEDLYPIIRDYLHDHDATEYALMGYSMGSIASFAMLQKIEEKNELPSPKHVFMAAHEPLTKREMLDIPSDNIDEYVKKRTIEFGTVDEKLINNQVFWRMYLPLYKADYLMIARFRFEEQKYATMVPATVFYSEDDTKYKDMLLWKNYYIGNIEFERYKGFHFFINDHYDEMASVIKKRLEFI